MTQSTELYMQQPQPWQPHNYQKKAVKFLLEHACAALFLDPGLGKTSITMAAIKILKKKGLFERALLIAPLRVCHLVWPKEMQKWEDFNGLKMVVLHGPNKEKLLKEDADIYVINPEGLDWLLNTTKTKSAVKKRVSVQVDMKRFRSLGFSHLIIDELSKFKNTSSGRFKALKEVHHLFRARWGLTGSPAANGLMNLFGQCYILDQGRTFGPYITSFRKKYFFPIDTYTWYLKEGAEDEIYHKVSPLALRMAAEDYLEMPKLIENIIKVELPPDVRRIYDALEDDMIVGIDDHTIQAKTAAVASGKCRQVANGGIFLSDAEGFIKKTKSDREWLNLHTAKVDALEDLIEELQGAPLLIAYDFEHDLDRLKLRFGKDLPYIGGGVTTTRSKELEKLWNAGKLPYLFGHPASIAHGLNLQETGSHVVWHSLTYDYELYDQFVRRVRRQGNKSKTVFSHLIMAENTVDTAVLNALRSKRRGQNALFEALKDLAKQRRRNPAKY